jgi:hypothetical protein
MRGAWLAAFVLACGGRPAAAQPPPVIGLPVEPPAAAIPLPTEVPPAARPDEPARPRRDDFGVGGFGGFGAGGGTGGPGYNAAYYPTRPVAGQSADLGLVRQNLSLGLPVWRDGGDAVFLTGGVRNTLFFTDAVMPVSRRPFPNTLWNVTAGLAYTHKFDNGWTAGGTVSVGSASDRPFNSLAEVTANVAAFVRIPARNDRDAWLLGVFYSPVGNLNFPVPVVAYVWTPSDRLRVNVGLPFAVNWRPTDDLTLTLSYVPVANVNARLTYRIVEKVAVFGGFEWLNEAYLLADREDDRDRFLVLEKRLLGGVRWDVFRYGGWS